MAVMIVIALALIAGIVFCIKKKLYVLATLLILLLLGMLYVIINLAIYLYQAQIHGM